MNGGHPNPYAALERLFHEPSRLAIMSALCADADGAAFNDLKRDCELTDGNLSRHLHTLEEGRAVRIEKSFRGVKPLTTIIATDEGREQFVRYLTALEEVLKKAAESVAPPETAAHPAAAWTRKPARA